MSHGAVWVGLKALSSSLPLDPWTVKNVPSEIPSVWAGGSRGERLTQVLDLRVRVGGGSRIGWLVTASFSQRVRGERFRERERDVREERDWEGDARERQREGEIRGRERNGERDKKGGERDKR